MSIVAWPVVARSDLISAFRPGTLPTSEGPFRTLRDHDWATAGVGVIAASRGRAEGRTTLFSRFNLEAASAARRRDDKAARAWARAAARVERGPEFRELRRLLTACPAATARQVLGGVLPSDAPPELAEALRSLARATEAVSVPPRLAELEVFIGRVGRMREGFAVLERDEGGPVALPPLPTEPGPRPGDCLSVRSERLPDASVVVRIHAALDLEPRPAVAAPFDPFARQRVIQVTAADFERLSRSRPAAIRVMHPVTIEE